MISSIYDCARWNFQALEADRIEQTTECVSISGLSIDLPASLL